MNKEIEKYYKKLRNNQKKYGYKQYAEEFLKLMDEQIKYSSSDIEDLLLKPSLSDGTFSLFPISENFKNIFLSANYNAIASFIYHLNDIDISLLKSNNIDNITNRYEYFLKNKTTSIYYLFNLNLGELLLSSSCKENHLLIYLFLFFLPNGEDFLMFNNKGLPLLSSYEVSNENFNLLIEIAKDLDIKCLNKQLKEKNNLSIKLIDNYLVDIISNMDSKDQTLDVYKQFYPHYKMFEYAKLNCFPDNALTVLPVSLTAMYNEFISWSELNSNVIEKQIIESSIVPSLISTKVKKF